MYVERFGPVAVELDALHPSQLEDLIRSAVESEIDMTQFQEQRKQEGLDRQEVENLREKVMEMVYEEIDGAFY